jgi:hypothetical protein
MKFIVIQDINFRNVWVNVEQIATMTPMESSNYQALVRLKDGFEIRSMLSADSIFSTILENYEEPGPYVAVVRQK